MTFGRKCISFPRFPLKTVRAALTQHSSNYHTVMWLSYFIFYPPRWFEYKCATLLFFWVIWENFDFLTCLHLRIRYPQEVLLRQQLHNTNQSAHIYLNVMNGIIHILTRNCSNLDDRYSKTRVTVYDPKDWLSQGKK